MDKFNNKVLSQISILGIPRNVEVIVHGEMVETAQPGDHCDFTGTLIVIPDVAVLAAPGIRAELNNRARGKNNTEAEGLKGLKALGVRDLNYKLAFLACSITSSNPTVDGIVCVKNYPFFSSVKKNLRMKKWTTWSYGTV